MGTNYGTLTPSVLAPQTESDCVPLSIVGFLFCQGEMTKGVRGINVTRVTFGSDVT